MSVRRREPPPPENERPINYGGAIFLLILVIIGIALQFAPQIESALNWISQGGFFP